jgi:hypothetical protein
MSTVFVALAWVFAVGTCVCVAFAVITVSLAVRHQRERAKKDFVDEGQRTIARTWVVGDLIAKPELQAKARRLVYLQRWRSAEQGTGPLAEQITVDSARQRTAPWGAVDERLASGTLEEASAPQRDDIHAEHEQRGAGSYDELLASGALEDVEDHRDDIQAELDRMGADPAVEAELGHLKGQVSGQQAQPPESSP